MDAPFHALSQDDKVAKTPIAQEHFVPAQRLQQVGQKAQLVLVIAAGQPGDDHPRAQAEEGQEPGDGEAASGFLDTRLRIEGSILRRIGHGEAGAIHGGHVMAAPKVALRDGLSAIPEQILVNRFQAIQGKLGSSHAIGASLIGRKALLLRQAQGAGLAHGVPAGGTSLGALPQEGPESQSQGPGADPREIALVLLGETVAWNPWRAQELELMEGALSQTQKLLGVLFELLGPAWEIGSGHRTALILSQSLTTTQEHATNTPMKPDSSQPEPYRRLRARLGKLG